MPPFGGIQPFCHDCHKTMPELILILCNVDENHISAFTDVEPVRTFLPIKGLLTWESFTVNFLRMTFMLTVYA